MIEVCFPDYQVPSIASLRISRYGVNKNLKCKTKNVKYNAKTQLYF